MINKFTYQTTNKKNIERVHYSLLGHESTYEVLTMFLGNALLLLSTKKFLAM
jgi:hypothetical protein